jgi:hypothetical protein
MPKGGLGFATSRAIHKTRALLNDNKKGFGKSKTVDKRRSEAYHLRDGLLVKS